MGQGLSHSFDKGKKKVQASISIFILVVGEIHDPYSWLTTLSPDLITMAKPNNQKAKTNKPVNKPKPQGGKKFDENALTQLTSKIDDGLKSNNDHKQKRKQPPTNGANNQDRKRQRNSQEGGSAQKSQIPSGKADREALLKEIRELGGDEKDLELIGDIDSSDDELVKDNKKPVDGRLKDELAALSKELGFDTYQPPEANDEEDEDDEGGAALDDEEDVESDEGAEVEGEGDEEEEDEDIDDTPKKVGNMVSWPSFFVTSLTTNQSTDL